MRLNFKLYDIDPYFLALLKSKAEKEGTTLPRVIMTLLEHWLAS